MDRTYHIWTIGCQMNEADSRQVAAQLEARGYAPVDRVEKASLIVLNTCVVRQQAEDKALHRLAPLQALKRRRPETTIAVMGCLVGRREMPALRERFPWVDVFAPPSDPAPLLHFLESKSLTQHRAVRDALQDGEPVLPSSLHRRAVTAYVPAVLGCSQYCSFC
ncbi:MAG: tRNA (N6-isopentenyl adenosine(37)-C2)-methylthiotransferase MiaB, partial [Verrucomicrobia bacterium]|nr:tRNA (N6-isopentenyl adenosine(37)-C2)-methylthiotransferase MiaB [Verrucomicrobiota bacterium]